MPRQRAGHDRQSLGIGNPIAGNAEFTAREKAWVERNLQSVTDLSPTAFNDLRESILRDVHRGIRVETISNMLREKHGVERHRAEVIARDQVRRWYSELDRAQQEEMGVTHFRWRTSRDNQVCEKCRKHEGKRYAYALPPPEGLPGYCCDECRCEAEPDLEPFWDSLKRGDGDPPTHRRDGKVSSYAFAKAIGVLVILGWGLAICSR